MKFLYPIGCRLTWVTAVLLTGCSGENQQSGLPREFGSQEIRGVAAPSSKANGNTQEWMDTFQDTRLASEAEVQRVVDHAVQAERAILFANVDWSPLHPMKRRYGEFIQRWSEVHPETPIMFYYVDCTSITSGYRPLKSIPGWSELEENGSSAVQGWGELIWLQGGTVKHIEKILNYESSQALVDKTESLLSVPVSD